MQIKNGTFLLGNCLELMKDIPSGSVDMVLCDLPYGTTQNKWDSVIPFEPLWRQYWRIAKPNAAIVLTAQAPFDKILGASCIEFLKYEWIWQKTRATGHLNAKKQPMKAHENVLIFYRNQCIYNPQDLISHNQVTKRGGNGSNYGKSGVINFQEFTNYPTSVLEISNESKGFHPTQKPVALFEYLIKTYTNEGDTVLDNCAGSGTTAIAAENTGRKWICMEQLPEYYYKAVARVYDNPSP